jgi:hypothetical protein
MFLESLVVSLILLFLLHWYRLTFVRSFGLGMDPDVQLPGRLPVEPEIQPETDEQANPVLSPVDEAALIADFVAILSAQQPQVPTTQATPAVTPPTVPAAPAAPSAAPAAVQASISSMMSMMAMLMPMLAAYVPAVPQPADNTTPNGHDSNDTAAVVAAAAATQGATSPAAKKACLEACGRPPVFTGSKEGKDREPAAYQAATFIEQISLRLPFIPDGMAASMYFWQHCSTFVQNWLTSKGLTITSPFDVLCSNLLDGPWTADDPIHVFMRLLARPFHINSNPATFLGHVEVQLLILSNLIESPIPDFLRIVIVLLCLPACMREYMSRVPGTRDKWVSYAAFKSTFERLTPDTVRTICAVSQPPPPPHKSFRQALQARPSTQARPNGRPYTPTNTHNNNTNPNNKKRTGAPISRPPPKYNGPSRKEQNQSRLCWHCNSPDHLHKDCPNPSK